MTFLSNRIIQGDCARLLQLLPDAAVNFVLTDPPYLVWYRDRHGRTLANDDDPAWVAGVYAELYRVLKPDTFCLTFYGWGHVDTFLRAWRSAGFRPVGHIVWVKNYASSTRFLRYRHEQAYVLTKGRPPLPTEPIDDVQPWGYSGNEDHPTQKSARILAPLIKAFTHPGDLVLDPFAGSGSSLVAAASLGRRFLGTELDRQYCEGARAKLARVDVARRNVA
jgi:adenine-specific DNA-methyltransferase